MGQALRAGDDLDQWPGLALVTAKIIVWDESIISGRALDVKPELSKSGISPVKALVTQPLGLSRTKTTSNGFIILPIAAIYINKEGYRLE